LQRCVLEAKWHAVFIGNANDGTQWLVDKNLPCSGKDLAPAPFTVPHVAFIMNVVKSAVIHHVVVAAAKISLLHPAKEFSTLAEARTPGNVGVYRVSPSSHHLVQREGSVPIKTCVVSGIPPL